MNQQQHPEQWERFQAIAQRAFDRTAEQAQEARRNAEKAADYAESLSHAGRPIKSARWHARAHGYMQDALRAEAEALGIAEDWNLQIPEWMDHSPRWGVVTGHPGVGEGDESLPRDIETVWADASTAHPSQDARDGGEEGLVPSIDPDALTGVQGA